jgi:hypothetical protein
MFRNQGDNHMDNVDLSKEKVSDTPRRPEIKPWHPEKARMSLAYWVLAGIFFFFLLTIFVSYLAKMEYVEANLSTALLEICKTGLLPIVTLILGYYFSKNS